MKKIFLILLVSTFLVSCGQNNTKTPENTTQTGMTENQKMSETNSPKIENSSEEKQIISEMQKKGYERGTSFVLERSGNVLKNLDKATLVSATEFSPYTEEYFVKDKNGVYLLHIIEETLKKLEWIDKESFYFDEKNYVYRDKNFAYDDEGEKLDIDIKTLKGFSNYIMKDEKNVFVNGKKVPEIDAKNFQAVGFKGAFGIFYKNDTAVYYFDNYKKLVPLDVDANSFKLLGLSGYKDKNSIYLKSNNNFQKQSGFDVATFEALNSWYFKDKNGIYAYDMNQNNIFKIEGTDVATFKVIEDNYLMDFDPIIDSRKAKDKNNVYEYWLKVKE